MKRSKRGRRETRNRLLDLRSGRIIKNDGGRVKDERERGRLAGGAIH